MERLGAIDALIELAERGVSESSRTGFFFFPRVRDLVETKRPRVSGSVAEVKLYSLAGVDPDTEFEVLQLLLWTVCHVACICTSISSRPRPVLWVGWSSIAW